MKRISFACLFLCLTTTFLLSQSKPVPSPNQTARVVSPIGGSQADPKAQAQILDQYGKLPLAFEANHGQTDVRVKFLSRTSGYSLFLTGDEAVLTLSGKKASKARVAVAAHTFPSTVAAPKAGDVLRIKLCQANASAKVTGVDELAGRSNYFIGNDPAKWRMNVPTYAKVKYEGIYSGIDLVYYGNQRQLEYDFIVAPGADPRRIAFDVRGAKRVRQDAHGDLVFKMKTGEDEIRWHKPAVYQERNGTRQEIAAHYAITEKNQVGFELAKYDVSRPLYIDPLVYSTYLGGGGNEAGGGIAVDSSGNVYVTGSTLSTDFPTTPGAFQTVCNGGSGCSQGVGDVFVTKINSAGSALVYSTYLGGSDYDWGYGVAVDSVGNAYVTGNTRSTDFPTTPGAFQTACGDGSTCYLYGDAFVAKINPEGSALVYSTYLGGNYLDVGYGIAVDSTSNAYVTGITVSTNFPTMNALQPAYGGGTSDAFVAKINPTGSALVYSTYLGGSGGENNSYWGWGGAIAADTTGNAYVTGYTDSADFPITPGAFQTSCHACVFVTKFNPTGSAFVYSTYLGGGSGAGDQGYGIAADSAGNAYVTGMATSYDFPTKNPLEPNGGGMAFVTKLNPSGSDLVYSTFLGGKYSGNWGHSIAVDNADNVYVTGSTVSTNFPTTMNALQPANGGGYDAFVAKINSTESALVYSTYLGGSGADQGFGIAVDSAGNVYVTGQTSSTDFPTMNPLQPANGGGNDAFVAKISVPAVTPTATMLSSSPNPSSPGQAVTFTAAVTPGLGAPPDGETVTFMEDTTVLGTGALSSGSASFTTSALPMGSNPITAAYGGDSNFGGSTSNVFWQVVGKATTTTTLASSRNPSDVGQCVTFSATVSSPSGGSPTGYVIFLDGATVLATKPLIRRHGGMVSFTTSSLPPGLHNITADYGGDSNFSSSTSSPANQLVLAPTVTTLSSSPNPSAYGQAVTFTATVTSSVGSPPDGETVTFKKDTTVLGTGTLTGGSASFTTSVLNAGRPLIRGVYGGGSSFLGSTSTVNQVVSKATTTTTVTSSQNPSKVGQSVIFTARVTPQFSGTPVGSVTFYDAATALKTVSLTGGVASFTTSKLAPGTHTITLTYNGNADFTGSSAALTEKVR